MRNEKFLLLYLKTKCSVVWSEAEMTDVRATPLKYPPLSFFRPSFRSLRPLSLFSSATSLFFFLRRKLFFFHCFFFLCSQNFHPFIPPSLYPFIPPSTILSFIQPSVLSSFHPLLLSLPLVFFFCFDFFAALIQQTLVFSVTTSKQRHLTELLSKNYHSIYVSIFSFLSHKAIKTSV